MQHLFCYKFKLIKLGEIFFNSVIWTCSLLVFPLAVISSSNNTTIEYSNSVLNSSNITHVILLPKSQENGSFSHDKEGFTNLLTLVSNYDYDNEIKTSTAMSVTESDNICAFFNVSDDASYEALDREEFSLGLSRIHNTSNIFETFYYVDIEKGCEVTVCKLLLLEAKERVRKCYTMNESQSLRPLDENAPDPITSQYIVSTGCSCKVPADNCNSTKCDDSILTDYECGRFYKEQDCSECRYDVKTLNVSESFIPSNTFWCQSFIIRDGCRLSIDVMKPTGRIHARNYTGKRKSAEMDYVRYPNPSVFTCLCDVEMERENKLYVVKWVLPFSICAGIILVIAITIPILQRCGISIWLGKNFPQRTLEDLLAKFHHGLTDQDIQTRTEEGGGNSYVALGFINALKQPYQHKWEIPRDKITFDKKEPLGIGQFGKVYLGSLNLKDGSEPIAVAVKTAKISRNLTYLVSILEEIKTLAYIQNHPNICGMLGACTQNIHHQEALIVLELCIEGSLKKYILKNKSKFFESQKDEPVKEVTMTNAGYATFESLSPNDTNKKITDEWYNTFIKWSKQIACGMQYLSLKQVLHIDLAARNIFLTDSLDCKIGDFGLSQRLHDVVNYVRIGSEYPLPFKHMALESLTDVKFTISSDVWSYGVTLYEIFSLAEDPFAQIRGLTELIDTLKDGKRLEKPAYASDNVYQIMLQCWDAEPDKRPSFGYLKIFFENLL